MPNLKNRILKKENNNSIVKDNFPLRSVLTKGIIARKPNFIEKWALLIFFFILILLLGVAYFIKVPQYIVTKGTIIFSPNQKTPISLPPKAFDLRLIVKNGAYLKKGQIIGWLQLGKSFPIKSPTDGKVFLDEINDSISFFQSYFSIGYIANEGYRAEFYLPQNNFSSIEVGKKIKIYVDAYPSEKYGYLQSQITFIADTASSKGFLVYSNLTKDITNDGQVIHFRSGFTCEVLLLTDNSRLLTMFYNNIIKSVHYK